MRFHIIVRQSCFASTVFREIGFRLADHVVGYPFARMSNNALGVAADYFSLFRVVAFVNFHYFKCFVLVGESGYVGSETADEFVDNHFGAWIGRWGLANREGVRSGWVRQDGQGEDLRGS
jgi:hypothetical protein